MSTTRRVIDGSLTIPCDHTGCPLVQPGGVPHLGEHIFDERTARIQWLTLELDDKGDSWGERHPVIRAMSDELHRLVAETRR